MIYGRRVLNRGKEIHVENAKEIKAALERELNRFEIRRNVIHELLTTSDRAAPKAAPCVRLPIVGMARTVFRNAGRPLAPQKIVELICSPLGITPPDTPILTPERRAGQSKGFFRTGDGTIGVLPMNPAIQTVHTKQSSSRP